MVRETPNLRGGWLIQSAFKNIKITSLLIIILVINSWLLPLLINLCKLLFSQLRKQTIRKKSIPVARKIDPVCRRSSSAAPTSAPAGWSLSPQRLIQTSEIYQTPTLTMLTLSHSSFHLAVMHCNGVSFFFFSLYSVARRYQSPE